MAFIFELQRVSQGTNLLVRFMEFFELESTVFITDNIIYENNKQ